jgi:hypothetical protein
MAEAGPAAPPLSFIQANPELQLLCNAACQIDLEVYASTVLTTMTYMRGDRAQRDAAHATLNENIEKAEEIFDNEDELDKIIANEGRVTSFDTNDGGANYEPVLSGRSPTAATADNLYHTLLGFVTHLRANVDFLNGEMNIMNQSLMVLCGVQAQDVQAQVYSNILFFSTSVGGIRDTSLFPKYSFNILCKKQSSLLPELLVLGGRGVGSILNSHVCNIVRGLGTPGSIKFKIVNPTDTNKLWQVKICLFGNEFTFISIQVISMSNTFFTLRINPVAEDAELYAISNLCFSLYNKCLSKDFNCLCSLSELDTALFRSVITLPRFQVFVRAFLDNLIETLPNIKKQYFIMGLYNLAFCVSTNSNYTPETKAYELLFDRNPVGIDLFNKSMCFIKGLNQQTPLDTQGNPVFPEQIRFAMGGGKLYSIFQKALNAVRLSNPVYFDAHIVSVITGHTQLYPYDRTDFQLEQKRQTLNTVLNTELQHASVKPAADADFGCFYPEEGIAAGGIGASSCMAICMLLQLSLKQLINGLFAPPAPWNDSEIDIGNSCIGTPPTTLSSLRIVLKNIPRFYTLNQEQKDVLQRYEQYLGDSANIKATISPYDFVMKGSMKSYIFHIFEAVHSYIPLEATLVAQFNDIAGFLTTYCMVTQEGFSSPIKGILDIFYTLFIIENFANRTFVTQKINKELKRVAICAQILFLHYTELLPHIPLTQQILPILTAMIGYGYDGSNLLGIQFVPIMTKYVEFVSVLCSICLQSPDHLYYSIVPPVPPAPHGILNIPDITQSTIDRLNNLDRIENKFMHLLPECEANLLQLPVFTQTIQRYTDIIGALGTMGHVTTALYKNKLYASCRDAENKKEGVVAIMSAYQAFLWNTDKADRIRSAQGDDCQEKLDGAHGIFQFLPTPPTTRTVFDALSGIISTIVGNVDILDLGAGNTVDNYTFTDDNANARNLFLVFSWFITSVFGVKTKSKNTKVISIGRTYLQLLRETYPAVGPVNLFGSRITIQAAAAAVAVHAVIDNGIVPGVEAGQAVGVVNATENGRLCLAYSSERIFGMAINKYIKMDIDATIKDGNAPGITPQQYTAFAAAIEAGITPQQYNAVAAAAALAIQAGVTSQQYAAAALAIQAGVTSQQYAAAALAIQAGVTPQQYAAAIQAGVTPQQYAAAALAIQAGVTPQQYPAIAAAIQAGVTPQQYPAIAPAIQAGVTPQQYPAFATAVAVVITPEQYTHAVTAVNRLALQHVMQVRPFLLEIPTAPAVVGEQPQPQEQSVTVYPLSVETASPVFNQEIFTQLIVNLSRVPSGKGNKENAALYMRIIMRRICCCLDTNPIAEINNSMQKINNSIQQIQNFYPYNFDLHNLTKFKNLTNAMKKQWYDYLMRNILSIHSPEVIFNNMRLLVLLYNCIVFGNVEIQYHEKPDNLPSYLDAIGPIIDVKFKECQSGNPDLLELYWLWKREEPREIAAAAAAAAGVTAKKRQEELNAKVEKVEAEKVEAEKKGNNKVKTTERKVSKGPGARVAELAAAADAIRKGIRTRSEPASGGNTNNHTRRNKNKRKKNSKTKTKFKTKYSSKYKKVIPSSRSGSQSNRKKSKPKKSQKNVTFKRRRARK